MKYAIYRGTATNIGEEVQSIAAQRFLPTVDYYITKEQMNRFQSEEKTKLIMNAWYMERTKSFPPRDCVDPLLISMHFNVKCRDAMLSKKESVEFFKKHGPVGCRDMSTKKWLEDNNIPAYFSGCLTSTLLPNEYLRKKYPEKYILCVDCHDAIIDYVKKKANYPVYPLSKHVNPAIETADRMEIAKAFLFFYQNAYCVITTNLHTAIPCLAFNTRVCLIDRKFPPTHFAVGRFDGMEDYFNKETEENFLAGGYDFNNPPENPRAFEKTRDGLIEKCREFTGYDSNKPALDDAFNPAYALISSVSRKHVGDGFNKNIIRAMYFAKEKDIRKMLWLKKLRKVNQHDIRGDRYLEWSEFFKK